METENKVNATATTSQKQQWATPSKPASASSTLTAPRTAISTPKQHGSSQRPKTAHAHSCSKMDRIPFSPLSTSGSITSLNSSMSSLSLSSDAREAAKNAKLNSTMERIQKVQQLKEKWAQEKERKCSLYKDRRQQELKKLAEDNAQAAELRRKAIEKKKEMEMKEKTAKQEELSLSLQVRSQLAQDLEKQAKAKRRISMFLNNTMRKKALEKEAKLQAQKKQEEIELLSSRRLDFLELREAKKEEEMRRRESMHNRILSAQEEKKKLEELEALRKEEEKSLLELRHANWEDDHMAKTEEERSRRESMCLRGETWRLQKEREREIEKQQEAEELSLLKKREEDWKDVQRYKQQQERSRRESLAGRLEKWREEKAMEQKKQVDTALAEQMERELEAQALQDVRQYQESMKESRRQSLAYRLDKAKKDKDFEQGQKALQQMVNEELRRIEEQDRQDVMNYRQRILDARRQSLEYRNQTEYQERMRLEGERQAQLLANTADRELREAAWRDVQKYREEQRAAARRSLAWRLADAHRKKEIDIAEHSEKLNKLHLDLQCKREDWIAVQEYKKEEAERRRKSIAYRLDSWRQQKLTTIKEQERKDLIAEEEAMLREMDREELLAAKQAQEFAERKNLLSNSMVF